MKKIDNQTVPCVDCEYFRAFESGRLVRARCPRTGTAFLRFQTDASSVVLDPKLHTCREAKAKSQTFGKEEAADGSDGL